MSREGEDRGQKRSQEDVDVVDRNGSRDNKKEPEQGCRSTFQGQVREETKLVQSYEV